HALLRDCEPLLRERTVILITHRPASLGVADRVLLLRDGRLTDVLDTGHYLRTGEPGGTSPGQGTANGGQTGCRGRQWLSRLSPVWVHGGNAVLETYTSQSWTLGVCR